MPFRVLATTRVQICSGLLLRPIEKNATFPLLAGNTPFWKSSRPHYSPSQAWTGVTKVVNGKQNIYVNTNEST